jgi:adenylate cyclase
VLAALEIRDMMEQWRTDRERKGGTPWALRIGLHSGPVVAGVVGRRKFAYDIWGDTVNTASRLESSGAPGEVNISEATYRLVKDRFICESRGEVAAKNKGSIAMYFVRAIRDGYHEAGNTSRPNARFLQEIGR